jgi:hypothetical protein
MSGRINCRAAAYLNIAFQTDREKRQKKSLRFVFEPA